MADLWTVVSVCNFPIVNENKPTVIHDPISIPKAGERGVGVFIVRPAYCPEFMGASDKAYRLLNRDISAKELANAIVNDYIAAHHLGRDNGGAPGLFAVEGEWDEEEVSKKFKREIKEAKERHLIWAKNLVAIADDYWAEKKQRNRITAHMIHAANLFELDREWLDPTKFAATAISCPACGKKLHPVVAICDNCRCIVNKEKYAELEFVS